MASIHTRFSALTVSLLCCAFAFRADAAAPPRLEPVDIELVLAADNSTSIDEDEAMLQRQGVAAAFKSPEVQRAIQSGALGKIAVTYIDWSGATLDQVVVGWHVVGDKASADAFADALMRAPHDPGRGTALGEALAFAAGLIETNNYEGTQKDIDISGDGPSNQGRPPADVRDDLAARGMTINGLPILSGDYGTGDWGIYYGEIDKYYVNCVIGGPRSFALPAKGYQDFAAAIRRKLVLELSEAQPSPTAGIVKVAAVLPTASQLLNPLRPDPGVSKEQAQANCMGGPTGNRGFDRRRGF